MKKKVLYLGIAALLLLAASAGFAGTVLSADPYKVPTSEAKLLVDGSDEGYIKEGLTVGKATLKISVFEATVFVHVRMQGTGWISVAFNKQGKGMDGANMILGYLDNAGKGTARNDLGRGWTHKQSDKQDITEFYFSQAKGESVFEFSYPLKFAAGYGIAGLDKGGVYSLVVAGNDKSNNISSKHSWYAKAEMSF